MIAYLPQRVFEVTALALGLWMVTFGIIAIARPASTEIQPGQPTRPGVARAVGATGIVVGLVVGVASFFYDSEQPCSHCGSESWRGVVVAGLIGGLVLLVALAGLVWARRRRC